MKQTYIFHIHILILCIIHCCYAKREIWTWTSSRVAEATIEQLQNSSWSGLYDGLYAFCGASFHINEDNTTSIILNETEYNNCTQLQKVANQMNISFHVCLGSIPEQTINNPSSVITSAIEMANKYNWNGYNIDDETECAPRATLANFTRYVDFINVFSDALHEHNIMVTADVQALFGIENVSYVQNYPCLYEPWTYDTNKQLVEMLSNSSIDRWIEMDTYYFTLSRFMDALDWYVEVSGIPLKQLGIGIENRNDIEVPDGYVSRFHALWKANIDLISVFISPISDQFLMYLRRWKSYCANCPERQLSCFEPSVSC
eukprot:257427_1